jgi:flavin reductase (DIM6/NTAB) family NADH-FMN oxidoreductase RutF
VTIHAGHPFATPEPERNPLRRWRGRMIAPVSVWAAGDETGRAGWTLSSFLVADGEPPEVLGLLDEDSALADRLTSADLAPGAPLTVNLLGWAHRGLADAFAGVAPAPGGPFTVGSWLPTRWGPVLADAPGWLGARLVGEPQPAGWSLLVRAVVEHVELGPEPPDGMLGYLRGRYRAVSVDPGQNR